MHVKNLCKINDTVAVNKKPILDRMNKYKDHQYKERVSKQEHQMLAS